MIISGSTEYRRYQAAAIRQRYAVRFRLGSGSQRKVSSNRLSDTSYVVDAPKRLNNEMAEILHFKTATFAAFGQQRNGVWGAETASQKVEHFGLFFGAFTASVDSEVQGFGVDPEVLTFALMVFPQVWDWYLHWRERRRGFFTSWEIDMLSIAAALCREETGWLRQTPRIAANLQEIEGLISAPDIAEVQADWSAACDRMFTHARRRKKEIERVAKIHRDPFEPIMPVLEAPSPVGEYRRSLKKSWSGCLMRSVTPSGGRSSQGLPPLARWLAYGVASEKLERTLALQAWQPTNLGKKTGKRKKRRAPLEHA